MHENHTVTCRMHSIPGIHPLFKLFKCTRAKRPTAVDSTSSLLLRSTKTWKFDKIAAVPLTCSSSTSKWRKSYRCLVSFFHSISRNHRIVSSRTRCSRLCYIPTGAPAVAQRMKRNKKTPCVIESQITARFVALRCAAGGYSYRERSRPCETPFST